jgi:hypothetical protein
MLLRINDHRSLAEATDVLRDSVFIDEGVKHDASARTVEVTATAFKAGGAAIFTVEGRMCVPEVAGRYRLLLRNVESMEMIYDHSGDEHPIGGFHYRGDTLRILTYDGVEVVMKISALDGEVHQVDLWPQPLDS